MTHFSQVLLSCKSMGAIVIQDGWAIAKKTARCPNIWVPGKVLRVLTMHPATFPEICNGLLFRSILRMCVQKLKFVALPVPEIIGGTQKILTVPGYAHAPFSPKILKAFCSDGPCEYIKFDVCSFTHSWNNRVYFKKLGVPGFAHAPYSPKFLKGFCVHGPCEYTRQIWSS